SVSEVLVKNSTTQEMDIYINNRRSSAPVIRLALKYLLGENPLNVVVKTKYEIPVGQGFGMSAAGALSASYALAKIIGISSNDAIRASHFAEVQLKTGLGDVLASSFGGIEIRKSAGLPPWGVIEHIPGNGELVLCVIGKKLDTKKILEDTNKATKIVDYGKYCTKKILQKPSVDNLFTLSQAFTENTNLADEKILSAIKSASKFGLASMCMLGNSVFAMGKTDELCNALSSFGKIFLCSVDEIGARVLNE
ncbi:MAG: hypothetical protein JSU91_07225, partial [Thermoplasmatales archaeon]